MFPYLSPFLSLYSINTTEIFASNLTSGMAYIYYINRHLHAVRNTLKKKMGYFGPRGIIIRVHYIGDIEETRRNR